jgi:hypothetical protein
MDSSATLTPQEAIDLLHKLMTDSIKVHAAFLVPGSGVRVHVRGLVTLHEDTWEIGGGRNSASPSLHFKFGSATGASYGDRRAFSGTPQESFFDFGFSSALSISFPDSILMLFEVTE